MVKEIHKSLSRRLDNGRRPYRRTGLTSMGKLWRLSAGRRLCRQSKSCTACLHGPGKDRRHTGSR